jgi:hypothetical protein
MFLKPASHILNHVGESTPNKKTKTEIGNLKSFHTFGKKSSVRYTALEFSSDIVNGGSSSM